MKHIHGAYQVGMEGQTRSTYVHSKATFALPVVRKSLKLCCVWCVQNHTTYLATLLGITLLQIILVFSARHLQPCQRLGYGTHEMITCTRNVDKFLRLEPKYPVVKTYSHLPGASVSPVSPYRNARDPCKSCETRLYLHPEHLLWVMHRIDTSIRNFWNFFKAVAAPRGIGIPSSRYPAPRNVLGFSPRIAHFICPSMRRTHSLYSECTQGQKGVLVCVYGATLRTAAYHCFVSLPTILSCSGLIFRNENADTFR